MNGSVIVVPAGEQGRGGGHLVRCMALVRDLRSLGREAWLFLTDRVRADNLLKIYIADAARFDRSWIIAENNLRGIYCPCIVLDRFQTSPEELARWKKIGPVIGIDEGGPHRNAFDFLIDILPNISRVQPNIADPSLLSLPKKKCKDGKKRRLKILVSFGHEDSAGLGITTAKLLVQKNSDTTDITLLKGGLRAPGDSIDPQSLTILESVPHLSERLNEYDLIITHYGLTAFESLYAGVPVLLISPTAYHEKLARNAGFYSLGVGKNKAKRLIRFLFNKDTVNHTFLRQLKNRGAALARTFNLDHEPQRSLAELINSFTPDVSRHCPVCGSVLSGPALARFIERSYHRCQHCGIISMNRLTPPSIEYDRGYFFEAYQKQYGKTYLEDFPHLIAMGKKRLSVIKSLPRSLFESGGAPRLLDIGCAYGPFLVAAREEGFSPCGIDPAEDAVRYVSETLGIPAVQGFFPVPPSPDSSPALNDAGAASSFDVITMWYVIEHFRDCVPVLREIHQLLKPGGILACATPSFSGVSGRASIKRFLEHSPADHWTIWSPEVCRGAFKMAGFTVKKTVNSGHHPERFPLLGKYAQSDKSLLYRLLSTISVIFSLGDTFEVYAVKE